MNDLTQLSTMHSGLVSGIIGGFDSVLLYVVKAQWMGLVICAFHYRGTMF